MDKLKNLVRHINALRYDIRAEVIVNDLLMNKVIDEGQYVIQKQGQFSRAYRYDILQSEITDYDYDSKQIIRFDLSRDSLYDMLPENIIHNVHNDSRNKDVDLMIKEYQVQKQQQKAARAFFQPFENEMFHYGVDIENMENDFLFELNNYLVPDMFYDFWGIEKNFSPLLISKFICLLPFAYKIVGNVELACHILSVLLEEDVNIISRGHSKYADETQSIALGDSRLGLDFIAGSSYDDYSGYLDVQIGPLKNSPFTDYIHEGNNKRFVEMFYDHFFPIEVEINTIILLPENKQNFEFNDIETPVLGYNTCI